MNFFIKIEDAINNLILKIAKKLKVLLPNFLFEIVPAIKKFIPYLVHFASGTYVPKIKITLYKGIGHCKHYFATGLGYFTEFSIYLRSDEFKHNKSVIIKRFFKFCAEHPKVALYRVSSVLFVAFISFIIANNTKTIVIGTHKMRAPASSHNVEYASENEVILKNHKFQIVLKTSGGHSGAGGAHHKEEILLDVTIEAPSKEQKKFLEEIRKPLLVELEAFEFNISALPLSDEEKKNNEKELATYLNHEFFRLAHDHNIIKKISLKQSPKRRPAYFDQEDRTFSMKEVGLQIFLEDTNRNRQVIFDYSILASNRNVVLFLKDHEAKVRDHFSTQIEPIIPRLPIEDEGKSIIKDKIRFELNEMLKKEKIEGRVLEVYLDYILGS